MDNIEKLYGEWLSLQPLKEEDSIRLNQKFMLEFNYNSNHMEGNTLTYKASFGQIKPFINYMKHVLEEELDIGLKIIHRHSGKLWYMNGEVILFRRPVTEKIIEQISSNPKITVRELSDALTINKSAVQKEIKELQNKEYIKREGGTRGRWHVLINCTTILSGTIENGGTI